MSVTQELASFWHQLLQPAGFDMGETGVLAFDAGQPLWWALCVGLGNTLRVCLPAMVLATGLGLLLALMRQSGQPALALLSRLTVGTLRQTPLLLQLLIWYFLLLEVLPAPDGAWELGFGCWLSKAGLSFPWPHVSAQTPWHIDWPRQDVFNVVGGASVTPEYLAVLIALVSYTGAFMSEVFRAGLESVSRQQLEAADTLGATAWQRLVRVAWPQAWRAVLPPATSQYLNLVKNSSLAVAVGYPELVSVSNTAMNQTGRAVACVMLTLSVYLLLSLFTAWVLRRWQGRWSEVPS